MSLLKELLLDKKIFEAKEEIEQFIEAQDIEPGSIGQRLEFDKSVFTEKENVNDFLEAHFFHNLAIEDEGKKYTSVLFDEQGFVESTMKEIEIREGVMIVVGILRPMSSDNPLLFNDDQKSIKLSSELPYIIELATVVEGFHVNYGPISITKDILRSFKDNFENNAYGVDISIDFDHETREAAGWLKDVFLSENNETLFGVVRWTPKGALSLSDREFRYFSPEFNLKFVHPHSGTEYGPTLVGGALVNRPFLKMDAIVGLKDKKQGAKIVDTISLSDHKAQVSGFETQIAELKLSENTLKNVTANLKEDNKKLSDEIAEMKAEIEKKEIAQKHQKLFDDGKINKAQLTALNEGKDMLDVLSLSEKMNGTPAGDGNADNNTIELSDKEKAMCEKLGLTAEEFQAANEGGQ